MGACSRLWPWLCSVTLGWPLALRPALYLSRGQCFLSLGCFLSEWKAKWQARVLGSCPAGSGYSDVASGHLAVTWSGMDSSLLGWPCSHSLLSFRIQIQLQVDQSHGHS